MHIFPCACCPPLRHGTKKLKKKSKILLNLLIFLKKTKNINKNSKNLTHLLRYLTLQKVNKKKQAAAEKFLKFITSEPAQQLWLDEVGELPSRRAVALREKNLKHPKYGPFIRGLEYAVTTDFKSESAQRKTFVDMFDRVVLTNMGIIDSLRIGAMEDQIIISEAQKR